MEIIEILILIIIAIEGALLIYDKDVTTLPLIKKKSSRREVYGTFQNPLGDTYRKNSRKQYVPIKPNSKMLDGDEEDGI